jgi:predicted MFS family arabinose efflux permease
MVPHHGTEGPLHYRAFRHSLVARVVSSGGSWMQTVAAGWLIYRLTGSAAAVGVLTVASRGPALVLSSVGGELTQRHDPRRLAIALALLQVVPPALLAVLASLDADTTLIIYALVLAGGILSSLALAPSTWISSHSVPPELRRKAIGESSVAYNIARFFGPLVAGGLIAAVGPEACFAVNAGTYLLMAWALWTLPQRSMPKGGSDVSFRTAVQRAFANPVLGVVIIGSLTFAVLVAPIEQLAPVIARRHGEGAHLVGFLFAGLAAGGILGTVLRTRLEQHGVPIDRLIGASLVATAIGMVALALAPNIFVAVGALVCCGTFWEVIYVECLASMQTLIPSLSGVLTGVFFTLTLGGLTLGALLMGELIDLAGVDVGLSIAGAATGAYGVWRLARPSPRAVPATDRP